MTGRTTRRSGTVTSRLRPCSRTLRPTVRWEWSRSSRSRTRPHVESGAAGPQGVGDGSGRPSIRGGRTPEVTMSRAIVIAVLVAGTAHVAAQSGATNGEWRTYGGDLGNTRYSPLDQINAANFSTLEVAWRFKTDKLGPRPEFQFESTPLMAGGIVYSTAGTRRAVVALDATTGEMIWMHSEREGARGAAAPRQLSGRGLAYWTDGREERILYVTPGYRLWALDA